MGGGGNVWVYNGAEINQTSLSLCHCARILSQLLCGKREEESESMVQQAWLSVKEHSPAVRRTAHCGRSKRWWPCCCAVYVSCLDFTV